MSKIIEWKDIPDVTSDEDLELDELLRNTPYADVHVTKKQKEDNSNV